MNICHCRGLAVANPESSRKPRMAGCRMIQCGVVQSAAPSLIRSCSKACSLRRITRGNDFDLTGTVSHPAGQTVKRGQADRQTAESQHPGRHPTASQRAVPEPLRCVSSALAADRVDAFMHSQQRAREHRRPTRYDRRPHPKPYTARWGVADCNHCHTGDTRWDNVSQHDLRTVTPGRHLSCTLA